MAGISPNDSLEEEEEIVKKNLPPVHVDSDSVTKLEVHYCVTYFRMPDGNCPLKNRAGELIRRVYINKS